MLNKHDRIKLLIIVFVHTNALFTRHCVYCNKININENYVRENMLQSKLKCRIALYFLLLIFLILIL